MEPDSVCWNYYLTPGPKRPFHTSTSPLQLFCTFFTDEVWDFLVTETNRYSKLGLPQQRYARPWHDVTVEDMKAFVGLLIIIGILQLPRLEMYWQTESNLIHTPGVSSVISRIRFEQIWRYLHLADNSQDNKTDKLFKVRHFVDLVRAQFSENYTLHQPVTIDEAMIPYKGRLSFKQYMKNKPTKWGIKVFVLSDATNGYIYRLQIYTGKNLGSTVEAGLSSRVLLELMTGLDGHQLYTENYYTSPTVYLELYENGINCCGTVRTNRRGFPKELIKAKRDKPDRGYYDYLSNGPLVAAVWYDRRYVYFLSTMHLGASRGDTVKRRNPDGRSVDVSCPPLLPDYQQYMRGVDRGDQMVGYYNIGRRSKKWWKKVFLYIIECALLNAYLLEKNLEPELHSPSMRGRKKRDYLGFRLDVAEQFIGSHTLSLRSGRPSRLDTADSTTTPRLDTSLRHYPIQDSKKMKCVVCNTKRLKTGVDIRHESRIKCSYCGVFLCMHKDRDCFQKYHTVNEYWI